MQKTKNYVSVVLVAAVVFWSGCADNGIVVEYHIPSKLNKLVITADETNGQNVFVKNGIARVCFDKNGLAKINTFKTLDRWHQKTVVLNGKKLSQFNVEVNYVELKMNTVETPLPGGGVRSDSIENGTSKIYEIRYK